MIKECTTKKGIPNFTKDEVIKLSIDYYNKYNKLVLRDFKNRNGLPSSHIVTKLFGTFENLLKEANILISENKKHNFGRECLSDDEMLRLLKDFTEDYLKTNIFLPTGDEIDLCKNIPTSGIYVKRFNSLENTYKLIGYNLEEFNNTALENDMLLKYKNMCDKVGYVLNSRDITKLSKEDKDNLYSTEAYINHFGSLHNLQDISNMTKTRIGRGMSKQECLDVLKEVNLILGYPPTLKELKLFDFAPSSNYYLKNFGSYANALKEAGLKSKKQYKTKNGTKCSSSYEYKLALVLEHYNYEFKKEVYYKNVIDDFNRNFRFDFVIKQNGIDYYVELFGISNNKKYNQRKQEKIQICKDNNIPLIEIYEDDVFGVLHEDLHIFIQEKINKFCKERQIA